MSSLIFTSRNPATGAVVAEVPIHSPAEVEQRLAAAAQASPGWAALGVRGRAPFLRAIAEGFRKQKEFLARTQAEEMGRPITAGMNGFEKCALTLEYYADKAEGFLSPEVVDTGAKKSYVRFDPLGAVLAIMPWNFPFWQVVRFAAPALVAGNVGLLKHASNVPRSTLALEQVFNAAGLPPGVFQALLVPSSGVEALIADSRISAVTLTGSEAAGASVAATAGKYLKKAVLELGGSDPFIVLEDADISLAASVAVNARLQNTGQSCIAAKRFIVVEQVAAAFIKTLQVEFAKVTVGDPLDPATTFGPLATAQIRDGVASQVEKSVAAGANVLCGGAVPTGPGFFYPPTILTNVTPNMPVMTEEVFGPVAAVVVVKDEAEAIALANSSPYGLGASIWSRDTARAEAMAPLIQSGAVFINSMVKSDPRLPFGGVKRSGYGRELGRYGLLEFVNIKTVVVA